MRVSVGVCARVCVCVCVSLCVCVCVCVSGRARWRAAAFRACGLAWTKLVWRTPARVLSVAHRPDDKPRVGDNTGAVERVAGRADALLLPVDVVEDGLWLLARSVCAEGCMIMMCLWCAGAAGSRQHVCRQRCACGMRVVGRVPHTEARRVELALERLGKVAVLRRHDVPRAARRPCDVAREAEEVLHRQEVMGAHLEVEICRRVAARHTYKESQLGARVGPQVLGGEERLTDARPLEDERRENLHEVSRPLVVVRHLRLQAERDVRPAADAVSGARVGEGEPAAHRHLGVSAWRRDVLHLCPVDRCRHDPWAVRPRPRDGRRGTDTFDDLVHRRDLQVGETLHNFR